MYLSVWIRVIVMGFVVNYESVVDEEESVRLAQPWFRGEHCAILRRKFGHVVDHLPSVLRFRNAERHREIERLHQTAAEIVPLNHAEIPHLLFAHLEPQRRADRLQTQETTAEIVPASIDCI
jgi:hypothetical protein